MLRRRRGEGGAKSEEGRRRGRVMKKRGGKKEKLDCGRWADYCAAGRSEEGTGGAARERAGAARHLSEKKTTSRPSPPSVISPERETGAVAGRGFARG